MVVPSALPEPPEGRTVVIGAGKAAAGMAAALEAHWPATAPLEGLVVTRYGHAEAAGRCTRLQVVEAAHPVPDQAGRQAAEHMCALLQGLSADDLVVALISGGGSALLSRPLDGISFEDKQDITRHLLRSGATIGEMNVVRQHLSAVKGGRLAALAAPARVHTLVISDVPDDAPEIVASGPTIPGIASAEQAMGILARYGIPVPDHVMAVLRSAAARTPKPDDPCFAANQVRLIASARLSLEAAAQAAEARGIRAMILSDSIEGESREVAKVLTAIAKECASRGRPAAAPCVLLSGGETSVTVKGQGRGGRNAEFALSAAIALRGATGIHCLAADTDGIDGTEDNAGAFADGGSFGRMLDAGVVPLERLERNDAYTAFQLVDDLFVTGPTGTNVNDFRAFLIV